MPKSFTSFPNFTYIDKKDKDWLYDNILYITSIMNGDGFIEIFYCSVFVIGNKYISVKHISNSENMALYYKEELLELIKK